MYNFATDLANLAVPAASKKNNGADNIILFDPGYSRSTPYRQRTSKTV